MNLVGLHLLLTIWFGEMLLPILGWGTLGHEMVANLASQRLTNQTRNVVLEILGPTNGTDSAGSPLGAVANWADHVREIYHWSGPLHYIDIRDDQVEGGCPIIIPQGATTMKHPSYETGCHFEYTRDCPDDNCVAGAIQNYTRLLETWRTKRSLRRTRREQEDRGAREALMFLTHFVGDIHQPLHSARASDKGGNDLHVHFSLQEPKHPIRSRSGLHYDHSWNLHSVWDTAIIERAIDNEYGGSREFFEHELEKASRSSSWTAEVAEWLECSDGRIMACINEWAEESVEAALEWAYRNSDDTEVVSGSVLCASYYETRLLVVKKRILASGIRLAATLEKLFSVAKPQTPLSVAYASSVESMM